MRGQCKRVKEVDLWDPVDPVEIKIGKGKTASGMFLNVEIHDKGEN